MALTAPILDNRTYQQLKDELVGRIRVYAPEWTDHNESDPGIALLELFAHLGESLLYRFNQIPDTTKVEFLRLLGVRPRPAQSSRVLLVAATQRREGTQVLQGTEAAAGEVLFETDDEVYVWPVDLVAAGKTPAPSDPDTLTDQQRETREHALAQATNVPQGQQVFYTTTVVPVDPLAPGASALDVTEQVDHALWIALVAKPTTDIAALAGQTLFVGIAFDEQIPDLRPLDQLDPAEVAIYGADLLTRDPPPMTWQLWNADNRVNPFIALPVLHDTTRGLLTSGVVKVVLPADLPRLNPVSDGVADAPPPLDDAELAAKVIGWIKVFRPGGDSSDLGDRIPPVRWVGVNAVQATQARTATAELLGSGTGDEDQTLPLAHRPILPGSVVLEVEEAAGWRGWTEVDDFVATSADDRHYTVDRGAGTVSFGRDLVPQIGERIRVLSYRYGGGAAGNVTAGTVTALSGAAGVDIKNMLAATGGADPATLTDALDEIPAVVHRHDRAVVAADFEQLAAQVAGVSRANTLARTHPDNPTVEAAGVVSVVVFGPGDAETAAAPLPDLGLLRRVARHLNERRLVTTELYVIPPEYVSITVSVGVQVRPGYQADAVRRWAEQIIRQYLAPLPDGGPDGAGWPLGRTVRRAELEAVAVQVEGVEYITQLRLGRILGTTIDERDTVELAKWQLPTIASLTISVGNAAALGVPEQPAPVGEGKIPVPVPIEVC